MRNPAEFDLFHQGHEEVQTSYPDTLKYWQRNDDSPAELNTYYDRKYQSDAESDQRAVAVHETKAFNIAIKTNYNARIRHEFGVSLPDSEETFEERESNFMFKALNPGLWKFMYDASAYLVFSAK